MTRGSDDSQTNGDSQTDGVRIRADTSEKEQLDESPGPRSCSQGGGPPRLAETIVVPDPGPGRRLCPCSFLREFRHTDFHYREGGISNDFPFLLGHEAAGEVVDVGSQRRRIETRHFVVLNWRAVCGTCRACRKGKLSIASSTFNATQSMTLDDGTPLSLRAGHRGIH